MGNKRQNFISFRSHQEKLVQEAGSRVYVCWGEYIHYIFLKETLLICKYNKRKSTVYQSSIYWFKCCPSNSKNLLESIIGICNEKIISYFLPIENTLHIIGCKLTYLSSIFFSLVLINAFHRRRKWSIIWMNCLSIILQE